MQLFLFFDTETTGLPLDYNAPSTDLINWPRLVQISWIISDGNGIIISEDNYIIKPKGFTIPDEVAKLHGITTERALEIGDKIEDVLHLFWDDVQKASYIIGHNVSFDENVVEAEFFRMGENKVFSSKHSICTKLASTDYCKIPNPWNSREYKWPKLSELYSKLFGTDLLDAHNSEYDVQATFQCFWRLKELGIITCLESEGGIIHTINERISDNILHYTTFEFNACDFYGYGKPTTDFTKSLCVHDWILFVEGNDSITILFYIGNKAHLMNKGKGISGNYYLKDKNSIILSFGEDSYYLHCVYFNEEIMIFRFDQSTKHIMLFHNNNVFHTVNDIQVYLTNIRHKIDLKRDEERKRKAIEQENLVNALIEDICRIGVKASDTRVVSLKQKFNQLSSIIGKDEAAKYQTYIDRTVYENRIEKEAAIEARKRAKEKREIELITKSINWSIIIVYTLVWIIAIYYHVSKEWQICDSILTKSAWVSGFFIWLLLNFSEAVPKRLFKAKVLTGVFSIFAIVVCLVYDEDYRLFKGSDDVYLNKTVFHLFDSAAKENIRNYINDSSDIDKINRYLKGNISGYYVKETKKKLYYECDLLCSKSKTLGDWRYIILFAPEKYKEIARMNYARLDSLVWDDEELAYVNAKSLGSLEAYDQYLSRKFENEDHILEIKKNAK